MSKGEGKRHFLLEVMIIYVDMKRKKNGEGKSIFDELKVSMSRVGTIMVVSVLELSPLPFSSFFVSSYDDVC